MARSTYIYVVRTKPGVLLGAFTVKYEMLSSLMYAGLKQKVVDGDVFVSRAIDGTLQPVTNYSAAELWPE